MDFNNIPPETIPAIMAALDNQIMQLQYVRHLFAQQIEAETKRLNEEHAA